MKTNKKFKKSRQNLLREKKTGQLIKKHLPIKISEIDDNVLIQRTKKNAMLNTKFGQEFAKREKIRCLS